MRHISVSSVVSFAVLAAACASPLRAADVAIALHDARSQAGTFQIALVDADGYAGTAAPVAARQVPPEDAVTRVAFDGIAPGRYAVMVVHDENGNGRLDSNLAGIPVEGYGFSNNPRVLRRPTFAETAFDVGDTDVALDITIR